MTPENTQKLFDAFPYLYRGRTLPQSESAMLRGFTCFDGWFDLVWNLSQAIEDEARNRAVEPQSKNWPEAITVKQEFGVLVFNLRKPNATTDALISEADLASQKVCEICGAPGSPLANKRNWVRTLCPDHAEKFLNNTLFRPKLG